MKKIIALFVIMLGLSFSASAQQKKAAVKPAKQVATSQAGATDLKAAATKDVAALNKVATLNDADKQSLQGLFEYKYGQLNQGVALSQDRKDIIAQTIEAKLRATLSADQMAKVDNNPTLLKQLTH